MSFLSVQNTFLKSHNNNAFLLSEPPSRNNAFVSDSRTTPITENNNQINTNGQEKSLQEVWSKHKFEMNKVKIESVVNFNNIKMSWAEEKPSEPIEEDETVESQVKDIEEEPEKVATPVEAQSEKEESPSHHARRPPNAFLIFCKKHRSIVRERYPNLENRGVTKILGEWWALLHNGEKLPYNDLAKEYKDAFLSANPNFRWYKLPAPPLRTLMPRPAATTKTTPPLSSPSNNRLSEFTPGKLADESQLGGLTSLMNNNFTTTTPKTDCCTTESVLDNNNHKNDENINSFNKNDLFKANDHMDRFHSTFDKGCARNILSDTREEADEGESESSNMTKQDLMNKVVDGIFAKQSEDSLEKNGSKEVRKSERMCKGKRYEVFMMEGRLLGNKRDSGKFVHHKQSKIESKIETELNSFNNNVKPETPKLDLGNTIKRLAERTNVVIDFENQTEDNNETTNQRARSISETSEGSNKSSPPNFNLDLRISNLPCLSYDEFLQRKRESKKRKIRIKTDGESKHKMQKLDNKTETQLVGSKKRKNKQSITHLGKKENEVNLSNELLGLATLAEVAANTEKINEQISE
ncbi:hypothetical protein NQ315_002229 [Exocentrus adspersus]|uniref:HMG box domain-containing protein n=1 Tax=Exocentrus adspersus TaxID=1586481 RepID=A0AAV8VYY3_9CUCU|nr:hypothetical protein NQ315_002229 [Exocentrus adspersus]